MAYSCCFSLWGNLDFLNSSKKSFITSITGLNQAPQCLVPFMPGITVDTGMPSQARAFKHIPTANVYLPILSSNLCSISADEIPVKVIPHVLTFMMGHLEARLVCFYQNLRYHFSVVKTCLVLFSFLGRRWLTFSVSCWSASKNRLLIIPFAYRLSLSYHLQPMVVTELFSIRG